MTTRCLCLLILSIYSVAAQTVQTPQVNDPNTAQQTKPEDRCTIEGAISSLQTGQPIRKAEVVLRRLVGNSELTYSAASDASGHYTIENIQAGRYSLLASRNGYVSTSYGNEGKKHIETQITLLPGQQMTRVDMRLPPQAVVTGRVVDEDGEPMARVHIQLMSRGYRGGKPIQWPRESGTTDDKGEYRLFGISAGRYWLRASVLSDRFVDEADNHTSKKEQTSYPATYFPGSLFLADASPIQIAAGLEVDGIDFHLAKQKSFTISGKLVNTGKHRDTDVWLMPNDSGGSLSWDRMKDTTADDEGKFAFNGLQPGRYFLIANISSSEDRVSARSEVVLSDSDVATSLVFTRNPNVHGTVRFDDPAHALKPDMSVALNPEIAMIGGSYAEIKDDGSFTLKSVPAERLSLSVNALPEDQYIKSVQLGDTELDDVTVDLTNGVTGALTITISAKGAAISGTVQDDGQKSVSSGTVLLVPDDRKLQSRFKTASPDQNGQFVLKNIHPGSYKLFAFDSAEYGIWLDPDWLKQYESKGESVELKELEKAAKNLTLIVTVEQ